MPMPNSALRNPIVLPNGQAHAGTVMLSQAITHPNIHVGDYSYASDFAPPQDWAIHLAPYLFAGARERLVIGRFCQIAHGVRFITSSANHAQDGLSCYPFPVFDPSQMADFQPDTRDTIIGHDVWLGYGALILPGARIGDGAIVGAGAVVRGTVPPYGIVTGNPASVQRYRFSKPQIARLLSLKWWHWPQDLLARAEPALLGGDLDMLESLAPD